MDTFQDVLDSNCVIKGIAIVKSTANKSSCNSFGDNKRHIPANTTKVTNTVLFVFNFNLVSFFQWNIS